MEKSVVGRSTGKASDRVGQGVSEVEEREKEGCFELC